MFELSKKEICIRSFIASQLVQEGYETSYAFVKFFEGYYQEDLLTRPSDHVLYDFNELTTKELYALSVYNKLHKDILRKIKDTLTLKKMLK